MANSNYTISQGDILCGNIGYSMQIPVFYRVVRLTPSGKSAVIRRLATVSSPDDEYGQYGAMVPDEKNYDWDSATETKRIKSSDYFGEYVMVGCHHMLTHWDRTPKRYDYMD